MISNLQFLCLFIVISLYHCIDKPRGVPFSKLSFYKPNTAFKCIDGSGTIDWLKVNDDYCDCRDGSDEPGTSACYNGIFYCENKGHKAAYILSSRVNDGICDCCDGEDEYSGIINCTNNCWELGSQAREELERIKKAAAVGYEIYKRYVQNYENEINEKRTQLESVNKEYDTLNELKVAAEKAKNDAEAAETNAKKDYETLNNSTDVNVDQTEKENIDHSLPKKAFEELDVDQNQAVTIEEVQTHKEFDIDQNGEVSKEEANEYMNERNSVMFQDFEEFVWPQMKEIYKFKEPEPTETEESGDKETPPDENNSAATSSDTEAQKPPPPIEYDQETKNLIETANQARQKLQELNDKIAKFESDKKKLEELLNIDFGPNNSFFELGKDDKCFELDEREYIYKLCPFKRAVQVSKSGGETDLGSWGKWGQGLEEGTKNYRQQIYENGVGCWNGPNRNTKVLIECGAENQLLSASEPSRCEYLFKFSTPAACDKPAHELSTGDENDSSEDSVHSPHLEL